MQVLYLFSCKTGFYASAIFSGFIVQMVACLTEKSEVTGLISSPTHPFVEIDHEIFPSAIFSFPLIQKGQLSATGESMGT